jgi:hypothetical protein
VERYERLLHAVEHSLVGEDLGEDPDRWLVLGQTAPATSSRSSSSAAPKATRSSSTPCRCEPTFRRVLER